MTKERNINGKCESKRVCWCTTFYSIKNPNSDQNDVIASFSYERFSSASSHLQHNSNTLHIVFVRSPPCGKSLELI